MNKERNASDSACKKILRNNECFADLCNVVYFQGKQVIKPENLFSQENDLSTLIGKELLSMETKRYRDIVRKANINGTYMIIGVEHQSSVDKEMIYRILNYDALLYKNQVESKKEVQPVGTFVFYTGDKEWTYPDSLKGTLKNIPPEMEKYINDWRFPILDIKKIDFTKLRNQHLRDIVEISQGMYQGSYEGLRVNRMVQLESIKIAAIFTHTDINEEDLPEGDEINMCKAMDQLFQRLRDEGIERGESIGIEKGKLNTLKELLKVKFGYLSSNLEEQLTKASLDKLEVLTVNIFNINSEEDVLKIIN